MLNAFEKQAPKSTRSLLPWIFTEANYRRATRGWADADGSEWTMAPGSSGDGDIRHPELAGGADEERFPKAVRFISGFGQDVIAEPRGGSLRDIGIATVEPQLRPNT